MVQCFVLLCSHRSEKNGCKMLRFPTSPKKRWKWKRLSRRADVSPNKNARICSCHFKEGVKNSLPVLFAWNKNKQFSPEHVQKKRVQPSGGVVRHLSFNENTSMPNTSETEGRENLGTLTTSPSKHLIDESEIPVDAPISPALLEGCGDDASSKEVITEEPVIPVPGEHAADDTIQTLLVANSRLHQEVEHLRNALSAENARLHLEVENLNKRCADIEAENILLRAENDRIGLEVEILKKRCSDFLIVEAENTLLRSESDKLNTNLQKNDGVFLFRTISDSDRLVSHFTGLPNKQTFFALLKMFDNFDIEYSKKWNVKRLNKETQLFMTLIKLRRGLSNIDLGVRFKVHETTVANVFTSWIIALHHILVKNLMATVPSNKKNLIDLPECFKEYPQTRMVIDCTEVSTANPTLIKIRNQMYSNYKHRITSKCLVGIAPNGTITFVSELFAGSTSDRKIVAESGVLNCLVPGDNIMADKGFNIEDMLPDGVGLNIPPFKTNPQFTKEEVDLTTSIARARIHVERAIARTKHFQILQFIPESLCHYSSEIFQICAALTNFQRPLIADETDDNADELL